MSAPFYRELAHPADLCLEVWGATRADLFAHAAQALFETMSSLLRQSHSPLPAG